MLLLGLLVTAALVRIIILMFQATKRQKQDQVMPEKQQADTVHASLQRDITDQLPAYAQGLRDINVYRLSLRSRRPPCPPKVIRIHKGRP